MHPSKILIIAQGCHTWPEFKTRLAPLGTKEKGDAFESLTQHYLRTDPRYASLLRSVWHHTEIPLEILRRLGIPHLDEGIDLVAETKDGAFWAIQCKYRDDEDSSLTRRDLATFTDLVFGISGQFEYALIATTTNRCSDKVTGFYGDRIGTLVGDTWRALNGDFFAGWEEELGGRTSKRQGPTEPRPHQQDAVSAARQHYGEKKQARGKIIYPCGTGKSLIGYWAHRELGSWATLVAVPSLALVRQTLGVWLCEAQAHGEETAWTVICSDDTIARSQDEAEISPQELGVKIQRNPTLLADWLRSRRGRPVLLFTTYQSAPLVSEACGEAGVTIELAVLDEAHKTAGAKDGLFAHLLHDANLPIRHRLFMTATERCIRGQNDNERLVGMENEALYGPVIAELSFKQALEISPSILCDYRIVTMVVTRADLAEGLSEGCSAVIGTREVDLDQLVAAVALRKAVQQYGLRHAISFHRSVKRAREFQYLQDDLNTQDGLHLESFHVSGEMSTAARDRRLRDFQGTEPALVTNARCLTEGVDLPGIDAVLFADPKKSAIDIVQAAGRAMRLFPGKTYGYILVPVFLESEHDLDAHNEAFGPVLDVVARLATQDERIIADLRARQATGGYRTGDGGPLDDLVAPCGDGLSLNTIAEHLHLRLWDRAARLGLLKRPFPEALAFARSLDDVKTQRAWHAWSASGSRPADIPGCPDQAYRHQGWEGWGHWLGTKEKD